MKSKEKPRKASFTEDKLNKYFILNRWFERVIGLSILITLSTVFFYDIGLLYSAYLGFGVSMAFMIASISYNLYNNPNYSVEKMIKSESDEELSERYEDYPLIGEYFVGTIDVIKSPIGKQKIRMYISTPFGYVSIDSETPMNKNPKTNTISRFLDMYSLSRKEIEKLSGKNVLVKKKGKVPTSEKTQWEVLFKTPEEFMDKKLESDELSKDEIELSKLKDMDINIPDNYDDEVDIIVDDIPQDIQPDSIR